MTRECNHCGCPLSGISWAVGNVRKNNYICRKCDSIKGRRNRLKRLALDIGLSAFRRYSKTKEGYVYVLSNPAWPGWVKVGMAVDAQDRCGSYQTSSPFRDYTLHCSVLCSDRRKDEQIAHTHLEVIASERRGEWFQVPVDQAQASITGILKQQNSP